MKHSEQISELASALVDASKEMPVIGFDATNPFLRNKYASLGAVIAATRPVLAKHGLAMIQFPTSQNGTIKRIGQENVGTEKEPEFEQVTNERAGTVDIGIETTLLHKSGQWLSGEIFVQVTKEKGKSVAQVSGSIISYLRRYAWSSVLGLYADEDNDGNEPAGSSHERRGGGEATRFEDLPRPASARPPSTSAPPAKPALAPSAATASPANTLRPLVADLRKKLGPLEPEFVRCLNHRQVNVQGQVALVAGKGLDDLSDGWCKFFLGNWALEFAAVDAWCAANPAAPVANGQLVEEIVGDDPEAWRAFPMPFGDKAGTPLDKLDRKYLFGLWANVKVETEYNGRPIAPEEVEKKRIFRQHLDALGAHYQFHT